MVNALESDNVVYEFELQLGKDVHFQSNTLKIGIKVSKVGDYSRG